MQKENKSILVIIIVLLIIFLPLSLLGIYLNFANVLTDKTDTDLSNNSNISSNEKYKDGTLYFYDSDNNLLGTYNCIDTKCSYGKSIIDDTDYSIDYLNTKSQDFNIVNNRFIFINDENKYKLYDIANKKKVVEYEKVKNYNNMMQDDLYIVMSNNKWGVVKIGETIETIIDFQYDFIGLVDNIDSSTNLLNSDNYVVKKDGIWYIVDKENDLISNPLSNEIASYNDVLIGVKSDNTYYLYDYYGQRKLDINGFNYISFTNKYINIVDKNNNLYIYDYVNDKKISDDIKLDNNDYSTAFSSTFNQETNSIDLVVKDKTYNYNL